MDQPVLLLGIFLSAAFLSSLFFKKFHVPHVVVYLTVGFVITNTIFSDLDVADELETWFKVSETLALGLIGFKIGTELKLKLLKREYKFITIVLLGEAGGAFTFVFVIVYGYSSDFILTLMLSGIAMATAPAATVEILRKLKSKGEFTTKIQWLLAFDDVIAVLTVEAFLVMVVVYLGGNVTLVAIASGILQEIGYALIMGFVAGIILDIIVERIDDELEMMEVTFAILILLMGLARYLHTSIILTTMVIGAVVTNRGGDNYEKAGDLLDVIMSPIIMLFFVLVGARVTLDQFSPFPTLAFVYLAARVSGVIVGTYFGARPIDIPEKMKKSLGISLLAQGGVALGLVSVADDLLTEYGRPEIGAMLISTVIISTIFSEVLGSIGTEIAVKMNKEQGKALAGKRDAHWVHVADD